MMTEYFYTTIKATVDALVNNNTDASTVMVEVISDKEVAISAENREEFFILNDKHAGTVDEMVTVEIDGAIEMREADLQGPLPEGDDGNKYVPIWGRGYLLSVDSETPYSDVYDEVELYA